METGGLKPGRGQDKSNALIMYSLGMFSTLQDNKRRVICNWQKTVFVFMMLGSLVFNIRQTLAQTDAQSKFIPQCVLNNPTGNPADEVVNGEDCRSVNIYIILLFKVVNYLFGIVGALALLFFIYGGFTMILSRGNSEQTKKGIEIISAAIIGLVVVFGAYMLVRFLGVSIGLKSDYRLN